MSDLTKQLDTYLTLCERVGLNTDRVVTDLRHLAFWFEYYNAVLQSVARKEKPTLLKGTYKLINEDAQAQYSDKGPRQLIDIITNASDSLLKASVRIPKDELITYKYGSRKYARDEYIETIITHVNMHIGYLEKAVKRN